MKKIGIVVTILLFLSSCSHKSIEAPNFETASFPQTVEDIQVGDISYIAMELPIKFMNEKPLRNRSGIKFYQYSLAYPVLGKPMKALAIRGNFVYCQYMDKSNGGGLAAPDKTEFYTSKQIFWESYYRYKKALGKKAIPELFHDKYSSKD